MTKISSSADLIAAIDDRKDALKKKDAEINRRAGISSAALPLIRKRGGNMETDTMFLLAKALGLTITIQTNREAKADLYKDTPVNQQPIVLTGSPAGVSAMMGDSARPQPYITDIKIVEINNDRWALLVKKSDCAGWINVPIE
jgi:hypothetical protein